MAERKVVKRKKPTVKEQGYISAYDMGYTNGRDMEAKVHAKLHVCIDVDTARELYNALRFTYLSHDLLLVHALLRRLANV